MMRQMTVERRAEKEKNKMSDAVLIYYSWAALLLFFFYNFCLLSALIKVAAAMWVHSSIPTT